MKEKRIKAWKMDKLITVRIPRDLDTILEGYVKGRGYLKSAVVRRAIVELLEREGVIKKCPGRL